MGYRRQQIYTVLRFVKKSVITLGYSNKVVNKQLMPKLAVLKFNFTNKCV